MRHALLAGRAGWTFRALDPARMRAAAALLEGEHDFSAFRSSQCQAASPVRRLESVRIGERGPLLELEFTGNAFLHHMIRNIVGALVMVGDGRREPAWVGEVLASRNRSMGAPTFDAAGLYFDGVEYDPAFAVPSWGGGWLEALA